MCHVFAVCMCDVLCGVCVCMHMVCDVCCVHMMSVAVCGEEGCGSCVCEVCMCACTDTHLEGSSSHELARWTQCNGNEKGKSSLSLYIFQCPLSYCRLLS